jgi:hypothetical protein
VLAASKPSADRSPADPSSSKPLQDEKAACDPCEEKARLASGGTPAQPDQLRSDTFGTAFVFARDPLQAARMAKEAHKLLMILHVSGNFEDAGFT